MGKTLFEKSVRRSGWGLLAAYLAWAFVVADLSWPLNVMSWDPIARVLLLYLAGAIIGVTTLFTALFGESTSS